jgi:hypothetical protein
VNTSNISTGCFIYCLTILSPHIFSPHGRTPTTAST